MKTGLFFFLALVAAGEGLAQAPSDPVRFEQRLGTALPLRAPVLDLAGRPRPLQDYFGGRPVILYFGYAGCTQLCALVADGTASALREIRPAVGRDVDVIALSIDPAETADAGRARLDEALHRYGDPASIAGWHYLRASQESIRAIAAAAGFHYAYDPASRQFAHPSGFVVITPQGVISRYFLGVDFDGHDLARAVARAKQDRIGEPVYALLLRCFRGDGVSGRYGTAIWIALAVGVMATVAALAGWIVRALWLERQRTRAEAAP